MTASFFCLKNGFKWKGARSFWIIEENAKSKLLCKSSL